MKPHDIGVEQVAGTDVHRRRRQPTQIPVQRAHRRVGQVRVRCPRPCRPSQRPPATATDRAARPDRYQDCSTTNPATDTTRSTGSAQPSHDREQPESITQPERHRTNRPSPPPAHPGAQSSACHRQPQEKTTRHHDENPVPTHTAEPPPDQQHQPPDQSTTNAPPRSRPQSHHQTGTAPTLSNHPKTA